MAHQDALVEVWATRDGAHKWAAEIERVQLHEAQVAAENTRSRVAATCRLRPFRPPGPEEVAWLQQFAASARGLAPPLLRFKPLIYDGPSRTGKSERAVSWFGPQGTLVLNCQGVAAPHMKGWLSGRYRAVVCEESHWTLLWSNRLLFQSGRQPVLLGQSACNEHAYTVSVYGTPMILTSNNFWEDCEDTAAREWITANCLPLRLGQGAIVAAVGYVALPGLLARCVVALPAQS
jgi:hypothetical protein